MNRMNAAPEFLKSAYRQVRRLRNRRLLQRAAPSVDGFLVSYPKSGRTWLRYLLSCYFAKVAHLDFEPDLRSMFRILPNFDRDAERGLPAFLGRDTRVSLPLVAVSHRQFDASLFGGRPTIILIRDPRDVCVSAYFHETKHKQRYSGTITDFIEDQDYGVPAIVRYHNEWAKGLSGSSSLAVSYENMSRNTPMVIRQILDFLGVPVDEPALEVAVEKARFNQMQKSEKDTGIPGHAYDLTDDDSLRVRKGKVGGFADTLDSAEADRVLEICRNDMLPEAKRLFWRSGVLLD